MNGNELRLFLALITCATVMLFFPHHFCFVFFLKHKCVFSQLCGVFGVQVSQVEETVSYSYQVKKAHFLFYDSLSVMELKRKVWNLTFIIQSPNVVPLKENTILYVSKAHLLFYLSVQFYYVLLVKHRKICNLTFAIVS